MKEFSKIIREELTQGLRQHEPGRKNKFQLSGLVNLYSTPDGLIPYQLVQLPVSSGVYTGASLGSEVFPFPQLFVGKNKYYVLCATKIYSVNPSTWALTQITTYDIADPGTTKAITTGGTWEALDAFDTVLFTNGVCTIVLSGIDTITADTYKAYVFDRTTIQAMCLHKGRGILAGFNPSTFWGSVWETFWLSYFGDADTGLAHKRSADGTSYTMAVESNWVWWSSIGGGDLHFLFRPDKLIQGYIDSEYGNSNPLIMDILSKNEQGFAPMEFKEDIYAVRPLGDFIIVYGEQGIQAMRPVTSPSPTMQMIPIKSPGLECRGAVAGDNDRHIYLDQSGTLQMITSDLKVTTLGYKDYLYSLLGGTVIISHSAEYDYDNFGKFYISNSTSGFQLTKNGLSQTKQYVKSAVFYNSATVGFDTNACVIVNAEGSILIEEFDFELSGIKTIEWVRLGYLSLATDVQIAIDYRYSMKHSDTWTTSSYRNVNTEGVAYFPITGVEFRLRVKIADYTKLELSYVEFGIKHSDQRYKRSISIDQIR